MRSLRMVCLFVLAMSVFVTASVAQDTPKPTDNAKASQSFTRTAAPDPALPPLSMMVRLLVLTPEQEAKVRQIYAEHNKSYVELMTSQQSPKDKQNRLRELRKSLQKKLESVLTPQQLEKLRKLDPESMLVDRLTVALRLTEEQSQQLLVVMREQSAAIRAIEKEAQEKGWNEQQKKEKLAELRKQIDEKVNRILTPEQQQKLKQILQGEAATANKAPGTQEQPAP